MKLKHKLVFVFIAALIILNVVMIARDIRDGSLFVVYRFNETNAGTTQKYGLEPTTLQPVYKSPLAPLAELRDQIADEGF